MTAMKKFKIVVLGDVAVGKTSLIHRYKSNRFTDKTQETLGCDYFVETEVTDNGTAILHIWDTAGSERYQSITDHYYRKADAAIICVDVRDEESFQRLNYWINQISIREEACSAFICITKSDLLRNGNRKITAEQIESRGAICNAKLFTTSSKTGDGVYEMFQSIASELLLKDVYEASFIAKYNNDQLYGVEVVELLLSDKLKCNPVSIKSDS